MNGYLPEYIEMFKEEEILREIKMAEITKEIIDLNVIASVNPCLSKNLSVQVVVMETGDDEIPQVRCYTGDVLDNVDYVRVRLDRPEYADSGGKEPTGFTTKQNKDDYIRIMNEPTGAYIKDAQGNFTEMTGYLYAAQIWEKVYGNGSYDKFKKGKNGLPEQLDYSVL